MSLEDLENFNNYLKMINLIFEFIAIKWFRKTLQEFIIDTQKK